MMIKIAFVIKTMNLKGGGAERVLATLFNHSLKNTTNIELKLYTLDCENNFFYDIEDKSKIILTGRENEFFSMFRSLIRLVYILKKNPPNYVVAFNFSSYAPMAVIPIIARNVKLIASEHSTYDWIRSSMLKKVLLYIADFFIYKYTVLSDSVAQTFPSYIQKKYIAIPNPVLIPNSDNDEVSQYDRSFKNVVSVGRLIREKNHAELINAFFLVLQRIPKARLYIYGDGKLRIELATLIENLGIQSNVFLIPSTSNIRLIYEGADLFCIPSLFEGFGLAAAEAMSFKLPVIGFDDCIGLTEFVTHNKNGILLKRCNQNKENLSNVITYLLTESNELNRLKENCRISNKYNQFNVYNQWLKLFHLEMSYINKQ
jgi:glycosyltransferase involved in cell wall biosynthesis